MKDFIMWIHVLLLGLCMVLIPILSVISIVMGVPIEFLWIVLSVAEVAALLIWIFFRKTRDRKGEEKMQIFRTLVASFIVLLAAGSLWPLYTITPTEGNRSDSSVRDMRELEKSLDYKENNVTSKPTPSYKNTSSSNVSGKKSGLYNNSTRKSEKNSGSYKNKRYNDNYDEGYEAVYDDGDYDMDRYDEDETYANGVDDALDDEEEYGED